MGQAIRNIQYHFENQLWEVVIPWLESNRAAKKLIHMGYTLRMQLPQRSFWVRSLFWTSLGFSLGLGLGSLIAYIF